MGAHVGGEHPLSLVLRFCYGEAGVSSSVIWVAILHFFWAEVDALLGLVGWSLRSSQTDLMLQKGS